MRTRTVRTAKRRNVFLTALAAGNTITASCELASIGRTAIYAWRNADPAFADAWDNATEASVDLLEAEARRRAMAQSDLLLIFLLRHHRPAVYRPPRQLGISGIEGGAPIAVADGKVCVYLPHDNRSPFKPDQ